MSKEHTIHSYKTMTISSIKTILAISLAVFFWSSALVGIRIGLQSYDPGSLALLRHLVASVGMLFLYLFNSNRGKPRRCDIPVILVAGMIGIGVYNIALNFGELTVNAGIAGFIISLIPVAVTFLAVLFLGEKVSKRAWQGVFISVLGVLLIAISHMQGAHLDIGILYVLIATLCGGIYNIAYKSLTLKYDGVELTAFVIWGGTLILLLLYAHPLWRELHTAHLNATLAAFYLGIFPSVIGYTAWNYGLRVLPASRASHFLYLMPIVSTLLSWLVLGEVPEWLALCGGLIALMGAIIANQYKKK